MTAHDIIELPSSYDQYIRHGWGLVPIPQGTKGPQHRGWNRKENCLTSSSGIPPGYGVGLAHAYSGTCAIDIDDWATASEELRKVGIQLHEIYQDAQAVTIESGRHGHGKLLYQMPFGLVLPSKRVYVAGKVSFELRCASTNGLTVQDVLPPSIHPETRNPYQWGGHGHWTHLPTIPIPLLAYWQSLLENDSRRCISTGGTIDASWDEIRAALYVIDPNCSREEWITVGMALHHAGFETDEMEAALTLWDDWSSQSLAKYRGPGDVQTQWRSFRPDRQDGVRLGSLFHLAQRSGWQRPMPSVEQLFFEVEPEHPEEVFDIFRLPAPMLDMTCLPDLLRTRAEEVSVSVGCDPLVPTMAGLGAVCAAVDARTRLELMAGWKVPPILWLMTIGDPSGKKTPGAEPMLTPLDVIEKEDAPRYATELLLWEAKEAMHASSKKAYLQAASDPEFILRQATATPDEMILPPVIDCPPAPVPLRLYVSDITSQKLVRMAAERPTGLLCNLDEMSTWLGKINGPNIGNGEDRATWLRGYESKTYLMDRVGAGSIYCENFALAFFGNIQPRVFRKYVQASADDGLLQRFIPAVLRPDLFDKRNEPIPDALTSSKEWEMLLRQIHALPTMTYQLGQAAFERFREWQHDYIAQKRDERLLGDMGDTFLTALGKLEGTVGRIALVFHLIERPFVPFVELDTLNKALTFVQDYVIPAYRYAFGEVGGLNEVSIGRHIYDYVVRYAGIKDFVTIAEIRHSARRKIADSRDMRHVDDEIIRTMQTLEHRGWVKTINDKNWALTPKITKNFENYRVERIKAQQRRLDENRRIAMKTGRKIERKFTPGYVPDEMD